MRPERVASRFCENQIFGIGSAVREFVANFRSGGQWYDGGAHSAGNGALMRIAPVVIPHLRADLVDLYIDAALLALITHNDVASISSCVAFAGLVRKLLAMSSAPDSEWWLEAYANVASGLEGETHYSPRGGAFVGYNGTIWGFAQQVVRDAWQKGMSSLEACNSWHSGAYLMETVPCVLYILTVHGHDPEEAIVRAVNDTRDNDTVAAIVGAAVGALHGKSGIPLRWIDGLSGRTEAEDDGKVFELLGHAKKMWWTQGITPANA